MRWKWLLFTLLCVMVVGPTFAQDENNIVQQIINRDQLRCGVNGQLLGFSVPDPNQDGNYVGFDADLCRAIATAILGDPTKVTFIPVAAADRKSALAMDCPNDICVDLLATNATYTIGRQQEWDAIFAPTTFYDSQDIMVLDESGIRSLEDLRGGRICVRDATTSQTKIESIKDLYGFEVKVISGAFSNAWFAFVRSECTAITSDRSQLLGFRGWSQLLLDSPDDPRISADIRDQANDWWYIPPASNLRLLNVLDEEGLPLSQEPLGVVSPKRDPRLADIIRWTILGLFYAEYVGVSQQQLLENECNFNGSFVTDESRRQQAIALFTGSNFPPSLDQEPDFMASVVCAVGNYADLYERHFGIGSALSLPRENTFNRLWTQGGLLYAPPF